MIIEPEVMPQLLGVCPSFKPLYDNYLREYNNESVGLYLDLAEFAKYIISLIKTNRLGELPDIFDAIERLHIEGNNAVEEAATIGLLESLQNYALEENIALNLFLPYLGPVTRKYWDQVIDFWETGKIIK